MDVNPSFHRTYTAEEEEAGEKDSGEEEASDEDGMSEGSASEEGGVPSLMKLAAKSCNSGGAVAGLERQLKKDNADRIVLTRERNALKRSLQEHRDRTSRLLRWLRPREPSPPPDNVVALGDGAVASAMPTQSLVDAAVAARLTGSELWQMLQEQIAAHEMEAEAARIRNEHDVGETCLGDEQKAVDEQLEALREAIPALERRIEQTRIEVRLIVHVLLRTRELASQSAREAVAHQQECFDLANESTKRLRSLAVLTGERKGELDEIKCPLCARPMRVHMLDAPEDEEPADADADADAEADAEAAAEADEYCGPGAGLPRPGLRCANRECAACGFSFSLPRSLRWCHTVEMRMHSERLEGDEGRLELKSFNTMPWDPQKKVSFPLPRCTALFANPHLASAAAHCQTCKFAAGFTNDSSDGFSDGSDDSDDGMTGMIKKDPKCQVCRRRTGHEWDCPLSPGALAMFCAGCRENNKAFLYCGSKSCRNGPVCSLGAGRAKGKRKLRDLCGLNPCSRCSKLRCWNCYEVSPGCESGECARCGRKSESEYDREAERGGGWW